MGFESKIRILEEMFKQEKSIYKKVYILAFLQKLKKAYKPIKNKNIVIKKNEKIKVPIIINNRMKSKKVVLLNEDAKIYKIFDSTFDLSQFLGVSRSILYPICNEHRKNYRGIMAMWLSDFLEMQNNNKNPWSLFLKKKQDKRHKGKTIIQIKNGKIINEWNSVFEVSRELKMSRQAIYNILQGKTKEPKYYLKYKELENANL